LSRPGWLTYNGWSAVDRAQGGEVCQSKTDILPLSHATNQIKMVMVMKMMIMIMMMCVSECSKWWKDTKAAIALNWQSWKEIF